MRHDVLIVGAGPTGLVLALWLTRQGVRVRVLDKAEGPGTTSRALAVQARTLELYEQLDLTGAVLDGGHRIEGVNAWVQGKRRVRVPFGIVGQGLTPYPFLHIFPQDRHERLLVDRLHDLGVDVERRTEVLSFEERDDYIVARYRHEDGGEATCEASYIVGCDGARSMVRKGIGADFPGGTYRQLFYVADVEGRGAALDGELHVDLDEADFVAIFGFGGGKGRLVGIVADDREEQDDTLRFDDVSGNAIASLGVSIDKVNWFSTYRVHHRVADRFRRGRAFIAGDAGHVHSPAGGQGMNTGIGDAINLAWKLAAVIRGDSDDALLDTYEAERLPFARKLVKTTDKAFSVVTAEGRMADLIRTRLAPVLLGVVSHAAFVREFLFRTVSQTTLTYREGPLGGTRAGEVHAGDRLPWVRSDDGDNYHALRTIGWQVHVYGEPSAALSAWCESRGLPLHAFRWTAAHADAGLACDAAYLLRPDTYVGAADAAGDPAVFDRCLARHGGRVGTAD
ncbi:MAG: FAD-dependent oxidoreductase [Luteibacter sp.]